MGKGEGREGGGGLVFGESDAVVDALGVGACLIDIPGGKSIVLIFNKGHNITGKRNNMNLRLKSCICF